MSREWSIWFSLIGLLSVVLACLGFAFPFELLVTLFVGWAFFLMGVVSEVTVDWAGLASAIAALCLFAFLLHKLCVWLYANYGEASQTNQPWKLAWSTGLIGGIVLMFCAGTAMIGVVHQVSWLLTSKAPLLSSSTGSRGNLKIIGEGVYNYRVAVETFPTGATFNETGRPLHSWVTRMLPYMDGAHDIELYKSIKQELPWDDLLNRQPFQQPLPFMTNSSVYERDEPVDFNAEQYALAHYAANVLVMGSRSPLRIKDISDGTANTFMAGEVNSKFRPWGDPLNFRDVTLGINKSPDGFGSPSVGGAYFLRVDGSVQFVNEDVDPDLLKATATPDGGELDTILHGLID